MGQDMGNGTIRRGKAVSMKRVYLLHEGGRSQIETGAPSSIISCIDATGRRNGGDLNMLNPVDLGNRF